VRRGQYWRALPVLVGIVVGFLVTGLVADRVGAWSDPPIAYYYPDHGWAAQSHAQGHDGYGPSNFPTWYGGAAKDGGQNACSPANRYLNMQAAGTISHDSTLGTGNWEWPDGLVMSYVGCGVSASSRTLITTWMTSTWGGTAGYTYHTKASSSQCSGQGLSYPCGDWSTTSQVQISWWDSKSTSNRRKLLLHEWAHAWNLDDYCGSEPAMTKNGLSGCSWPSTAQYYDKDRWAFWETYGW
jgi:hypothetical protein